MNQAQSQEQMEFDIGEGENPATVEIDEDKNEAVVSSQEATPAVEVEQPVAASQQKKDDDELDDYSDKVKKRIDKMTARLRESQRREEAALAYAKSVQAKATELEARFHQTDTDRLSETRSRIETQAVALKQIIKKAREEGDTDTEMEAQERLSSIMYDQRQVAAAESQRQAQLQAWQQQQQFARQQAQAQPPAAPRVDPRAEEWAENNEWYGKDVAMTHAAQGIHTQLVAVERFDPNSDEYYDELNRRIQEAFPHKFAQTSGTTHQTTRANRPVQTVAPASRSSGINNAARRTVRLSPSQVAIAKKLGVPLEEYAKYVKE
jgi:hypothetical protein